MPHRRRIAAMAVSVISVTAAPAIASPAAGQSAEFCASDQSPRFKFGFAALRASVGDAMGEPIECEHANPENGDTLQHTTHGLSFYRKSTNTPTFTDGFHHWALTVDGLVSWTGSSIDPPGVLPTTPNATQLPTQTPVTSVVPATLVATVAPPPPTEAVTPTSEPAALTATPAPATPTATAAPAFGSRENPISRGSAGQLPDGWVVLVLSITSNATETVLAENQLNEPPPPGEQFMLARIQATYTGPGSARFSGRFRLRAMGQSGVSYSTFENGCRVIPDEIPDAEVPTGGTIGGNVCWSIRSSDVSSLLMYDSPSTNRGDSRIFFLLH
jgi:hypothetical protein